MIDLEQLKQDIEEAVLDTPDQQEAFRVAFIGKKQGRITAAMKSIPSIAPEDRKSFGQAVNVLKQRVAERLQQAKSAIGSQGEKSSGLDLSLPGRPLPEGSIHPVTQARNDMVRVFAELGFTVADGPEVEDDWHNFTALNFPPDHPARDMQDTLFIEKREGDRDSVLLRTHTSPVQIRTMLEGAPPIRVVIPGRVYRNETISYKSYCLFHQLEGLYVDTDVTFADLKQTLRLFAEAIFGPQIKMRLRPSFFPFTEPSAEVDFWWEDDTHPDGGKWLEILGCGMVDPNVLKAVDIDPEKYTGFAFGMGIDRVAMLRHRINDIRLLFENDVRFLQQFN